MDSQCGQQTPYCSPAGECVECLAAGNCPTNQTCDTNDDMCVPKCTTSATCMPPLGVCNTTGGYCVQCVANGDCTMNQGGNRVCDTTSGRCVQCEMDSDCPMERPRCDPMHQCVQCLVDMDCPTTAPTCSFGTCH